MRRPALFSAVNDCPPAVGDRQCTACFRAIGRDETCWLVRLERASGADLFPGRQALCQECYEVVVSRAPRVGIRIAYR